MCITVLIPTKLYRRDLLRSHGIAWTYNPTIKFFGHHVSNLFVLQTPPITQPIAQLPLSSQFLIFFLPSLLHSCPPVSLSFLVSAQLLFCHCLWFGSSVFSPWWIWWLLFLLSVCHYCVVCVRAAWYSSFHTRGLQYRSFVPLVGVSLPYCVCVLFQYTLHGTIVSVHPVYSTQSLFLPSLARHYSIIICM